MRALAAIALTIVLGGCAGGTKPDAQREPFAWEVPAVVVADRPIVDEAKLHRRTLANGLHVIVLEDRRLPEFSAGFIALRGAAIEAPQEAGLATFTAALMQRGAGARDKLALAAAVGDLGAELSANADWDSLRASVSGLSQDFGALFGVLADVVRRPRFDLEEAKQLAAEQRAALGQAQDDPARLATKHFMRALYGAHRLGTPPSGLDETVARFGPADARAFHARVVTPAGAILWAVGDVDAGAFFAHAESAFGDFRGAPLAPLPDPPPVPDERRVVVVDRPELGQVQVAIGHGGIARTDERRLEVQLMNAAFGGGSFSSRLMNRIRATEGLTYGISAQFVQYRAPGPYVISTFTRVPEVGKLLASTFEELARLRAAPPAGDELERARSQRVGAFPLQLESSEAVMRALLDLEVYGLPRDTLDTYRARMRAITAEQIAATATALVHPERATIVLVGPAAALREAAAAYGDVEVVAP
jgi:zinc protease